MPELGFESPNELARGNADGNSDVSELLHNPALETRTLEATTGTVLADAADPATSVFFVHSGQVRIYQSGPENSARLLEILGPGDWFGVPALAGAESYGTRAVAVSAVTVSRVRAENWLALLARQPGVATRWVARARADNGRTRNRLTPKATTVATAQALTTSAPNAPRYFEKGCTLRPRSPGAPKARLCARGRARW